MSYGTFCRFSLCVAHNGQDDQKYYFHIHFACNNNSNK